LYPLIDLLAVICIKGSGFLLLCNIFPLEFAAMSLLI